MPRGSDWKGGTTGRIGEIRPGKTMRRYHHLGIPTTERREGERHLPELGMHVSGFETSPYGIEWMRFEPGCTLPELVQTVPHVAFEVNDLDAELEGQELLIEPSSPTPGLRVAFIVSDGAPVELLEIDREIAPPEVLPPHER